MTTLTPFYFFVLFIFLALGCDKEDVTDRLVDPEDADALSAVLILPDGATESGGSLPSPSAGATAPVATPNTEELFTSNGSTAPLAFRYNNVSGSLSGCYVQVDGSGNYYTIPYTSASGGSGQLSLPIGIPTNVDEGIFTLLFAVYDQQGNVSNWAETEIEVLRLGTGALQISLSWDDDTDQDLHVTDPFGGEIYYAAPYASSGGELDRDDVDGYGPENIYWLEDAPDGTYTVEVNYYSGSSTPTDFYVTVNGAGASRSYSGTTTEAIPRKLVTTFTKSGDDISF